MKRIISFVSLFFSVLALSPTTTAVAAPYAIAVVDYYNPGSGPHTDPAAALGAPDAIDRSGEYSMGPYGYIELQLGQPVFDLPGVDFAVWEENAYFGGAIPKQLSRTKTPMSI